MVKNLPSMQETQVPGSGGSPRGGNGNPLQYSCLENPVDRGAWWATIHGVTKSQTQLGNLSTHALLLGDCVRRDEQRLPQEGSKYQASGNQAALGAEPGESPT